MKPVITIYHDNSRWRVEAPLMPDLEISSVTLWSLLNLLRDRVTASVERTLKAAKDPT